MPSDHSERLTRDGFVVLPSVLTPNECRELAEGIGLALTACDDESSALKSGGAIYGARNLLDLYPPALDVWRKTPLIQLLREILGTEFGLVRGLYFDKPPTGSWSLPWHRDLTIAVRDNTLPSQVFRNPTRKAGVPHVEAPDEVLRQMLTLRIHLDAATPENGPLQVISGSHTSREAPGEGPPVVVLVQAGDVLAMRPLLLHASGESTPRTTLHRRVIHLEFAANELLPDGYAWQRFVR
jgi:hypothetical protein